MLKKVVNKAAIGPRKMWYQSNLDSLAKRSYGPLYHYTKETKDEEEANLVSSESINENGNLHWPCLDIDYEAHLIPSKTKGHYHLYLQKAITWRQYKKLLKAMAKAGLIEEGYYKVSLKHKATFVRKPVRS